jgi:hypothetical protein
MALPASLGLRLGLKEKPRNARRFRPHLSALLAYTTKGNVSPSKSRRFFMTKVVSPAENERAILDVISNLNVRANEVFSPTTVQWHFQTRGIRVEEFHDALSSLGKRGWIASLAKRGLIGNFPSPKFLMLTAAGFKQL